MYIDIYLIKKKNCVPIIQNNDTKRKEEGRSLHTKLKM